VNGQPVTGAGTPLRNGDTLKLGLNTSLKVIAKEATELKPAPTPRLAGTQAAAAVDSPMSIIPIIAIAGAVLLITLSAAFVVLTVFGSKGAEVVQKDTDDPSDISDVSRTPTPDSTPKSDRTPDAKATPGDDNTAITDSPTASDTSISVTQPTGKKYQEMSDAERRQYLEVRAMKVAQVIGNRNSEAIPPAAIDKIKSFADAYASRSKVKPLSGCRFGDNLQATYERASKNAPFIVKAFNEKGMDPRIGLYLAMIESEHCVCLQSPTGPLGMFQFTKATAELHGLKVFKGASPSNPDERCEPEPAARAAASYMKALTGRYGTGPSSVPLAIGSYNSGEGGLSTNLQKALDSGQGLPRDFWTLIEKGEILSKQFQSENFKYVPKFFAAAIIGENPQDFGLTLQPISTYSK
jgi:hypothetical protein